MNCQDLYDAFWTVISGICHAPEPFDLLKVAEVPLLLLENNAQDHEASLLTTTETIFRYL